MEHLGTKQLETPRLILRQFQLSDTSAMYYNWASDAEVTKFLTWPCHSSLQVSENILTDWISQYDDKTYYQWAIALKEIGEPIGSIAVVSQQENIRMVHIGYCIGKKWWGKGIVPEALSAVIDFFFCKVGINRIECRHDLNNPNSGKVMQKCGMKHEGTMRQADCNNQGICDTALYSILADEYFKTSR